MNSVKIRKDKNLDKNELEKLSKEELVDKIMRMDAHNLQLRNIIAKNNINCKTERKKLKPFDFSRAHYRHVLLKFYYLGWDYQGFAMQEDTINTIEYHLFEALLKTCLIKNRESSNYHRCGRTDKGVSSFNQVISIDLRSKFSKNEQSKNIENEINYCKMLNRVLPNDIQCICWCPVPDDFSARFDCKSRTYKYFFPKSDLNINAMNTALTYLIGSHDFRNLCKMDVANGVVTFIRNIISANIQTSPNPFGDSPYDMYQLTLVGQAFLWHQVRCIVGILFLIGKNKEKPEIIKELLDVEKNPRKPNYNLASEVPLNLYSCEYEQNENWIFDNDTLSEVITNLQKIWTVSSVKTTMMKMMLNDLENELNSKNDKVHLKSLADSLIQGVKPKVYVPLMERQKCEALDDRIQHYLKKRRLITSEEQLL